MPKSTYLETLSSFDAQRKFVIVSHVGLVTASTRPDRVPVGCWKICRFCRSLASNCLCLTCEYTSVTQGPQVSAGDFRASLFEQGRQPPRPTGGPLSCCALAAIGGHGRWYCRIRHRYCDRYAFVSCQVFCCAWATFSRLVSWRFKSLDSTWQSDVRPC